MPKKSPSSPAIDFADIMVLLSRFRTLEKCQFGIARLTTTSSLVTANVQSPDDPLFCITKENEDLVKISHMMDALMESDRKSLQEALPLIFNDNGELTESGSDIVLVFLYLTGGSVLSIAETLMMLYSIEIKDVDSTQESIEEATAFLKPYIGYFTDRFVDKNSGFRGLKLTEEAEDRIEAVITQLKQSPRSFGGLDSMQVPKNRTVH